MLAERKYGVLEIDANEGRSLRGQLLAGRTSYNGQGQDEFLKRPERNTIYKWKEIKVPESVPFTLVYAAPELVCEKRVTGETLSFLDKDSRMLSKSLVE